MLLVVAAVVVGAGTFCMISKNNNLVTVVEAFQQTKTSIPTFHRRQQEQQQEFLANLYKWNPTTTTTTTRSSSSSPSSSRLFMASQPPKVDKGFNLLEIATKVVPQGRIVQTTKESWKFIWKVSEEGKKGACSIFFVPMPTKKSQNTSHSLTHSLTHSPNCLRFRLFHIHNLWTNVAIICLLACLKTNNKYRE